MMMMMKITNAVVELMCLAGGGKNEEEEAGGKEGKGAEVEVHSGLFSILFFVDCCADQQQIDLCLRYVPRCPLRCW